MKKLLFIMIMGLVLSSTLSAAKIKYYAATSELITEMGKDKTAETTVFYGPGVIVSAAIETVLAPTVLFWNLFQEDTVE